MRKLHLVLALVLSLLVAASGLALAGPVAQRVSKNKVLVVGTSADYPPFCVKDKNGQVVGLDMDLARGLAAALGVKLQVKVLPFGQLLPAVRAGELDLALAGITMMPRRNLQAAFVGPYFVTGQGMLLKASLAAAVKGPGDVNRPDFTVAVAQGTTGAAAAKVALSKAKLAQAANMEAALKLLLDGKAQVLVADFPFCALAAFRHPEANLAALDRPFTYEPIGMALPPDDELWANLLRNYLGALIQSGRLKVMQERWFKRADWMKDVPK
ncbi:MAG: transporter substrate-binding domain-containing protein [Thermodesulfobacteriota bacterium]